MIRLTRAGWIFIALTLFLGFSAVNTGNNLIYIIVSGFLSLMAVSGFFGRHNLKRIEVDIEFADEVYAMSETSVRVRMVNKKRIMPVFLLKANLLGKETLFHYLDPSKDETKTIQAVFSKRGINTVSSITVCSVFPFNFFVRCINVPISEEVLVLPRLIKCSLTQAAQQGKRQAEGLHSDSRGYESGIISLRLYQAGDPLRHIHWKAAAKTDKLLTKEFPSSLAEPVMINFDELDMADMETKISCVAYALNRLIRQGTPAGLVIEKKVFKPALGSSHRLKMLKELALYGSR